MKYELTFLLDNEEETKNIKSLLDSVKAKLVKEDKWGERSLAYPIKKLRSAKYFHWLLEMDENQTTELKKKLNFNDKIVRHLLLKTE